MSDTPVRRSIIRHVFIIIDLSESMLDKDYRPTRYMLHKYPLSGVSDTDLFNQIRGHPRIPPNICRRVV